ncbi:MAG: phosphatase PAP2 family protein [Allorhizobium sp.]
MLRFLRLVLFYLPGGAAVLLIVLLLRAIWRHGAGFWMTRARDLALALIALILGPYLLVNVVLKSLSGRPRPYETDLFYGHLPFAPAGSFSGACTDNCSFVSGEAAGAGWFACLILLLPARWRPILGPPILCASLLTPGLRLAFGGHFLSDVTLGWLSSVVIFCAVFACAEITRRQTIAGI